MCKNCYESPKPVNNLDAGSDQATLLGCKCLSNQRLIQATNDLFGDPTPSSYEEAYIALQLPYLNRGIHIYSLPT